MTASAPRLTELTAMAGCTGKAGAAPLAEMLALLGAVQASGPGGVDGDLLVGLAEPDDAAVYRVGPDLAIVLTVDFFAPIVDDPRAYGAVAAANAMSDVYAMGGEVTLALNIAAFPLDLDASVVAAVLRGGAEKVAEAGGVIAGGHTVIDAEPKYGLCVVGTVHPERILTKAGARPGDAVFLTKPLGTGLITTAAKFDEAQDGHLRAAIESMSMLNRLACRAALEAGVNAMTDVTGFGILGHGHEIAAASHARLRLDSAALPLLPGAMEYAYRGIVTGGGARNREYLEGQVEIAPAVSQEMEHILYDPQTSGGLLFTAAAERASSVEACFAAAGLPLWRAGEIVEGTGVVVA